MMRVSRSGDTSRDGHGDETVQAQLQGTGGTTAPRHAHAGAGRGPSRSSPRVRCESANGLELGAIAGRRPASLAASTLGSSGGDEYRRAEQAQQDVDRRGGRQRLSHRTMDPGAYRHADQARVRARVQHRACLARDSRPGLLEPTPHRAGAAARRGGDPGMEDQALASAKKNARRGSRPGRSKAARRPCSTASTGSSCR